MPEIRRVGQKTLKWTAMARFLKSQYEKLILYVFSLCKSAGTLIALGADEIVMSYRGELGPLDVQLLKTDELLFRGSGLDIAQALDSLSEESYKIFRKNFIDLIGGSEGAITTKTAAEIASSLAVGLITPITAQIDPLRVGEVERAIQVAYEYGLRHDGDPDRVNRLIRDYPSHSFVIDCAEAKRLFRNVREPTENETLLERALRKLERQLKGRSILSQPDTQNFIGYIEPKGGTKMNNEQILTQILGRRRMVGVAETSPRMKTRSIKKVPSGLSKRTSFPRAPKILRLIVGRNNNVEIEEI